MRSYSPLVACLLLVAVGCATPQLVPPAAASGAPPAANGLPYLALGDSYTIGEGAAAAARWPVQLAGLLAAQGVAVAAPGYVARTGWTTAELRAAIAAAPPTAAYGLVSLLIGANDECRGQSVGQYRHEFRVLLHQAIGLAGGRPGRVFVRSIPDWGQSPQGQRQDRAPASIAAEIDQLNAVAQDECRQANVAYVNITDLTRTAAGDRRQFARDGLHYSGPQMRLWADRALPVVRALLRWRPIGRRAAVKHSGRCRVFAANEAEPQNHPRPAPASRLQRQNLPECRAHHRQPALGLRGAAETVRV